MMDGDRSLVVVAKAIAVTVIALALVVVGHAVAIAYLDAVVVEECIKRNHAPEKCGCLVQPCSGGYVTGGRR